MWLEPVIKSPIKACAVAGLLRRPRAGEGAVPADVMAAILTTHRAAGAMAARLLDSTSEQDLAERIEHLVDDGVIVDYFDAILAELHEAERHRPINVQLVVGEEYENEVADQFEAEAAALVREALRLHDAGEASHDGASDAGASTESDEGGYRELLEQLPRLPLPIAEATLQVIRGLGAMLALLGAGLDGRKLAPWLARALARTWRDGELGTLRILACGDPSISEDVLPLSERLDLSQMEADTAATSSRLSDLFNQAQTSGLPVFPAPPDDDE